MGLAAVSAAGKLVMVGGSTSWDLVAPFPAVELSMQQVFHATSAFECAVRTISLFSPCFAFYCFPALPLLLSLALGALHPVQWHCV